MDELMREIERAVIKDLCEQTEVPEEIWTMIDSLIEGGCKATCVLKGMRIFSERMDEKHGKDALKELLKDLPVKFEEE